MYRGQNRTPSQGLKSPVSQAFSLSSYCPQIRQKSPCSHDRMMSQSCKSPSRGTPTRNENNFYDYEYTKGMLPQSRPSTPRKEAKRPIVHDRILDAPDALLDTPAQIVDINEHDNMAVALGTAVYIWSDGQVRELMNNTVPLSGVCWSGDNLIISGEGHSELWDVRTGRHICSYGDDHAGLTSAIKTYSNQLATAGHDGMIHIYDIRTPDARHRIKAHKGAVHGLAWSLDGTMLASSGADKYVAIIGSKNTRRNHDSVATALTWMPDGILLLGNEYGIMTMYNARSNEPIRTLETGKSITGLSWGRNWGIFSAHGDDDGTWCLWNKDLTGPAIHENPSHGAGILNLATSVSGDMVVTISSDETLRLCELSLPPSTPVKSPAGRMESRSNTPRSGSQFNVIRASPALMR